VDHAEMVTRGTRSASPESVFGTSRQLPGSYVPRMSQQERLSAALGTDSHLVIWGEPRQGKSSLLRHGLKGSSHCIIQCAYGQRRFDVYRMILREAGASVAVERKRRRSRGIGATVRIFSGNISSESETTERTFDIDISNINDVLRVIEDSGFSKIVVLEDFHYLGRSVQRQILQDMKAIYEKSLLKFILVGIWADRDQLLGLQMDIGGRVEAIEVPRWTDDELAEVVKKGEDLLRLSFKPLALQRLIACAQQSVGVLQDLALAACTEAGMLLPTQPGDSIEITEDLVGRAIQRVLDRSTARLRWYVNVFADPDKRSKKITTKRGLVIAVARKGDDQEKQPYKGILHALLIASPAQISSGIAASDLLESIHNLYPFEAAEMSYDDLIKGLDKLGSLHRAIRARPVLEYDSVGERLHVVDPLVRLLLTSSDAASLTKYLPDEGSDIETYADPFEQNVKMLYGNACAICPTTHPDLIEVVRLAPPAFGFATAPELGIPLCSNHAQAWLHDLLGFEPKTTRVMSFDPNALNITREDLSHLPAQPALSALEHAWLSIQWRAKDLRPVSEASTDDDR
jgi:hypothetical protein